MNKETEEILEATIVKVEGRPNFPKHPKEQTRWESFKLFLFRRLRKSKELAEAYTEAKVAKEQNEARKIAEEAGEIAARKDRTRQQEASEFNAIIDDIFSDDSLPAGAKMLKLAKLMEKNPQLASQLRKVKEIIEELGLKTGLSIEVEADSLKYLPDDQDFEEAQEDAANEMQEVTEKKAIQEELVKELDMPIQELELSRRASMCLESVKVETVGQLVRMKEADLLKIRGFGKTTLREVKTKLLEMGLSLEMIVL